MRWFSDFRLSGFKGLGVWGVGMYGFRGFGLIDRALGSRFRVYACGLSDSLEATSWRLDFRITANQNPKPKAQNPKP